MWSESRESPREEQKVERRKGEWKKKQQKNE